MMRYRHWDRIVTGVCAAVLGLSGTTGRAEPRPLADFREIVVADTPLPCQQAAADELAQQLHEFDAH